MADDASGKERTADTRKAGRTGMLRIKGRDPILAVCFTVLVLAFAVVIGVFVNDHYIKGETGAPAAAGDTVTVNYTGSYYGYYDENGAQIFDTSVIANSGNEDYAKSFEFTPKTGGSNSTISFTIGGNDSYLQMFKDAVIGKKTGESARVTIPSADGYGALTGDQTETVSKNDTMSAHETITLDQFTELYNISSISGNMSVTSPYGWPADASPYGQHVNIRHHPEAGSVYTMNSGVSVAVSGNSDGTITFDYVISFETYGEFINPDETETAEFKNTVLRKIIIDNEERYITAVSEDGSKFVTKNTDERTGMTLYFEITVVSITQSAAQTMY